MLQVLNVNYNDVVGGQFNNFECREGFKKHNIKSYFYVWDKLSNDESVVRVWSHLFFLRRYIHGFILKLEGYLSIQSILYPYSLKIMISRHFYKADVVHYHILHNGWFSLLAMPWLTRRKPSIWTIHDPWLLTGHCIYPMECEKWKAGCGNCPKLSLSIPMRKDRTAGMFRLKNWLFRKLPVKFVVASQWMKNMVEQSPIGKNMDITVIPFGVNLDVFKPASDNDRLIIRRNLGIPDDNIVLFFRSNISPFKGGSYIRDALHEIIRTCKKPVTIITVEGIGLFDDFIGKCQIIENLWEHNVEKLAMLYNACDIFLMPSTAEAFGLMAIEAMASGRPVVFFKGTSLDEITFSPRAGIGAKMQDAGDLARVVSDLADDDEKRLNMGKEARKIAEEYYDVNVYLERMSALYKDLHYKNVANAYVT